MDENKVRNYNLKLMLNTIYEEFDFESKIKDLKNKKIKIKRVIKRDPNSLTNSQMVNQNKESIIPTNKPSLGQPQPQPQQQQQQQQQNALTLSGMVGSQNLVNSRVIVGDENNKNISNTAKKPVIQQKQQDNSQQGGIERKKNNAMFYSTEIGGPDNRFQKPQGDNDSEMIQFDYNNNQQSRSQNPMFKSQDISLTRQNKIFQTDLQHMLLPQSVVKIIKEEQKNMDLVIQHIQKQKKKVDYEIDSQIREVLDGFNKTRKRLHKQYDDYVEKYKENYEILKQQSVLFKEKQKEVPTMSSKIVTDLTGLQIYDKDQNSDQIIKVKEENCKLRTTVDNIQKELSKKLMGYFADEISKSTFHLPLFNHSSTSQMLAMEIKVNLAKALDQNLSNFDHLVYKNPQPDFNNMSVKPIISNVISDDRYSVIGDFENQTLDLQITKEFQTTHQDTIMCVYALNDYIVATGGNDGIVEIVDTDNEKIVKQINVTHSVFSLASFKSDKLNFESKSMEQYLIVGGSQVNAFSINDNYNHVKKINIPSNENIVSITELRDSQTIALAGNKGTVYIYNLMMNKIIQTLTDHGASVNALVLAQDGQHLISGSSDRKILVYKLQFDKSMCTSCKIVRTIQEQSQVYSLNASLFKSNLVFSAGSDCKIKLWNIINGNLEREIVGHRSPISQMIIFENPFVEMKDNNYQMLSSGTNDEALRISNSICQINTAVTLGRKIENNWAAYASPTMQLIKVGKDKLGFVIASQEDKLLYTIQIN